MHNKVSGSECTLYALCLYNRRITYLNLGPNFTSHLGVWSANIFCALTNTQSVIDSGGGQASHHHSWPWMAARAAACWSWLKFSNLSQACWRSPAGKIASPSMEKWRKFFTTCTWQAITIHTPTWKISEWMNEDTMANDWCRITRIYVENDLPI